MPFRISTLTISETCGLVPLTLVEGDSLSVTLMRCLACDDTAASGSEKRCPSAATSDSDRQETLRDLKTGTPVWNQWISLDRFDKVRLWVELSGGVYRDSRLTSRLVFLARLLL